MQFILWRHAEAEIGTGNDLVRALTAKGHQQAKRTAHRINKLLPKSAKNLRFRSHTQPTNCRLFAK